MSEADEQILFRLVIGEKPKLAAVHKFTASLGDVIHARDGLSATEMWLKFYRPALEQDGFISEADFESLYFAESETLDNFAAVNRVSRSIDPLDVLTLVDTDAFSSRQQACSSITDCTGWWRFTEVGYNLNGSQAVLHTDYDHPKYGLMGMGHFVLLERIQSEWTVIAKHMTWIS